VVRKKVNSKPISEPWSSPGPPRELFGKHNCAVLAAALFCFTISLGEFLLAFFLIGHELTLPVYLYSLMRFTFTPAVNAAAVLIILFPTLAVIVAAIFFRREVEGMYV
jgi:spermidine/putrescine transport system permease protein